MALKALIVDDESDARENLRILLEDHCPEVQVVGMAGSAEEARKLVQEITPDLLFLDIKMPGEDGFELLRSLADKELPVVFTTAYDEYALRAFKENALDYLEKPIDPAELERAVRKVHRMLDEPAEVQRRKEAMAALVNAPGAPLSQRVAVPGRDGLMLIPHDEIVYLEAADSYTNLHLADGRRVVSSKNIRIFETNLDPSRFFRVHKSYIINLGHLKGFSRSEGNMALMGNGTMVPVSRRKLPEFLALMNTF
jgi:two-component system LytT family response regulator